MSANPGYAVIGAGPVGTLVAAALARNGHGFAWVVRHPERRRQLAELTLQFPDGSNSFDLPAGTLVESWLELPESARIILAVKAQDIDALVADLGPRPPASLLAIANGLHSGAAGIGLLYGGGFLKSGVLVTNNENELIVGGLNSPAADWDWAVSALSTEFLRCSISSRIRELMWHKLAVNCVINPLTALLDCDNGDLLGKLHGPLVQGILRETVAVMAAVLGDPAKAPSIGEVLLSVKQVLRATRYNSSSMREDLRQGRPTEIDQLNGAVVVTGAGLGIACPVNELVVSMISLIGKSGRI